MVALEGGDVSFERGIPLIKARRQGTRFLLCGTYQTAQARFGHWFPRKKSQKSMHCSLFARQGAGLGSARPQFQFSIFGFRLSVFGFCSLVSGSRCRVSGCQVADAEVDGGDFVVPDVAVLQGANVRVCGSKNMVLQWGTFASAEGNGHDVC